jgi:hypothetical protein
MKNKKWVQHISGQGEKWELANPGVLETGWTVWAKDRNFVFSLPKSEYVECEGPERWHECTRQIISITDLLSEGDAMVLEHRTNGTRIVLKANETRWAWKGDALVVERKVP